MNQAGGKSQKSCLTCVKIAASMGNASQGIPHKGTGVQKQGLIGDRILAMTSV